MRLFILEKIGYYENKYFYWAKDEGEALELHEKLCGESEHWVASQVFANNLDTYRGFVEKSKSDLESYNSGWQDGYRDALDKVIENLIKLKGDFENGERL